MTEIRKTRLHHSIRRMGRGPYKNLPRLPQTMFATGGDCPLRFIQKFKFQKD